MDIGTIIGIVAGFACVGISVISGGDAAMFVNIPSIMIVVGGMVSTTLIHFSLGQVIKITTVVKKTILYKLPTDGEVIQKMVNFAAINRRDGSLALEKHIKEAGDKFFIKGLRMVVDGLGEDAIERQLGMEIDNLQQRHAIGKQILEFMGASAPAFGMIGTLIGLVQMLGSLSDPSGIGVGMATALITTFYGAILANLVFIPLAGKLGMRSKGESALREMIVEGILGIVAGDAPTAVRERMQTFQSTGKRVIVKPKI
ncbi:MAG: MotA/TolQ/ExbB proton channel family protein [Phycisphaerae bacterium]|nr:MotA/TolQ/ExbB proton channel family protein [Phycisphaerae bacterium]